MWWGIEFEISCPRTECASKKRWSFIKYNICQIIQSESLWIRWKALRKKMRDFSDWPEKINLFQMNPYHQMKEYLPKPQSSALLLTRKFASMKGSMKIISKGESRQSNTSWLLDWKDKNDEFRKIFIWILRKRKKIIQLKKINITVSIYSNCCSKWIKTNSWTM
jgi:hypothetical protein